MDRKISAEGGKINENLIKILNTITSERELIGGKRVNEVELAKLQYQYFDKKEADPEIESVKAIMNSRFEQLRTKTNQDFTKLLDAKVAAGLLDQMYADKEIAKTSEQVKFIDKVRNYINKIKL